MRKADRLSFTNKMVFLMLFFPQLPLDPYPLVLPLSDRPGRRIRGKKGKDERILQI
jgi:hypothetical protein